MKNKAERSEKEGESKKKVKKKVALSFEDDINNGEGDDNGNEEGVPEIKPAKQAKMTKNPNVNTSFLADEQRDKDVYQRKEQIIDRYFKKQDELKGMLTYKISSIVPIYKN